MDENEKKDDLKVALVEQMMTLMTAAFGLIAALAWNDAIQTLFKTIFGEQSGLIAKFAYAGGVSVLVVFITMRASRLQEKLKDRLKK
jgi:Zn-dependent protease with chaperone function